MADRIKMSAHCRCGHINMLTIKTYRGRENYFAIPDCSGCGKTIEARYFFVCVDFRFYSDAT